MEWYKQYQPKSFEKVIGCETTVNSLRAMIVKQSLPHCILLFGPTGCGKGTIARILKRELNCADLDYKEMNSSSYRGIDTIRDIQQNITLSPSAGPCRVYVLDECHQISRDGMEAMLKMLEDTPPHIYFILCTTNPEKLIAAIRSRCCEMPLSPLTEDQLTVICTRVAKKEGVEFDEKTIATIAKAAKGSARTALLKLEKLASLDAAQREAAIEAGLEEESEALDLMKCFERKTPWPKVAKLLQNLKGEPESIRRSILGLARYQLLRDGNFIAYTVLDCFNRNFYDSGNAGLALAAYEVVHTK